MTSRTLSKEKIIAISLELIKKQTQPSFSNIAKAMGMRSQSIYNYFENAEELKAAIAVNFYQELFKQLQAELLGLSGKSAVKKFCQISTEFAINDFLVTQYVMSMPKWMFHGDKEVESSIDDVYQILRTLIDPLFSDAQQKLVVSRMLRNLIIGQIIHIGTGRFTNPLISADDSFDKMLEITLRG